MNKGKLPASDGQDNKLNNSEYSLAQALLEASSIAKAESDAEEVRVREALAISKFEAAADLAAAAEAERLVLQWAAQDAETLATTIGLGTLLVNERIAAI